MTCDGIIKLAMTRSRIHKRRVKGPPNISSGWRKVELKKKLINSDQSVLRISEHAFSSNRLTDYINSITFLT